MIRPISPKQASRKKSRQIPDFVIEAFNELIAKNYSDGSSSFRQEDVVKEILSRSTQTKTTERSIYDNHWLDVEDLYQAQGWKVEYNTGFNESGSAIFTFSHR